MEGSIALGITVIAYLETAIPINQSLKQWQSIAGPCVLSKEYIQPMIHPKDIDQTDLHRSEPSSCTFITDEHSWCNPCMIVTYLLIKLNKPTSRCFSILLMWAIQHIKPVIPWVAFIRRINVKVTKISFKDWIKGLTIKLFIYLLICWSFVQEHMNDIVYLWFK